MAEPISTGVMIAKIAAQVLSDKRGRKAVGWILVAIFSPVILVLVLAIGLSEGGAEHNNHAVDTIFYGGAIEGEMPVEYRTFLEKLSSNFRVLESEVSRINQMAENGNGLDMVRIQSIYYVLAFNEPNGNPMDPIPFVSCFVKYETRERVVTNQEGEEQEEEEQEEENQEEQVEELVVEEYQVAVPVSLSEAYQNIQSQFTLAVDSKAQEGINQIYVQVAGAPVSSSGGYLRGAGGSTEIDTSGFTNPSGKNSQDLVAYANQAFENGWGYVWGTYGTILTPELFRSKVAQYPGNVGSYASFIEQNWLNRPVTDCMGLIKGYGWLDATTKTIQYGSNGMPDTNANGMYASASIKGPISTMPDTPGLAVWHQGHIGVYVGNGQVVEAMNTKAGVVKTQLSSRSFTHWLQIPYIDYN